MLTPDLEVRRHLHRGRALDVLEVWSVKRRCGCVAKTLRADRQGDGAAAARLVREGTTLERLSHPHIVRAYETITEPAPVVVLETLSGKTLGRLLADADGGLTPREIVFCGLQLASALAYLHNNRLLHLDLKPSNVISECGRAKLIDLSVARPPGRGAKGVGTARYMAPEQALGRPLDDRTDSWGIGVVLFEAAAGRRAFTRPAPGERPAQIEHRAERVGDCAELPPALAALIDRCLEPETSRRPRMGELIESFSALAASEGGRD
jgi:serine/threonine protein kinase